MKGYLEKVPQRVGMSWRYKKIVENSKSYGWHRHEEYEIAIHRHFAGHSFIGHHQSDVFHNHMILVGPDLPHAIYSEESADDQRVCETHVVWFRKDWIEPLIDSCRELEPLRALLEDSKKGLQFSSATAEKATELLDRVMEKPPHQQLLTLFSLFSVLLDDEEVVQLINPIFKAGEGDEISDKLDKVEAFLMNHFIQDISVNDLASHLYISESSVRRLFQKHYKESFSQRLKKIRLNVACDLLINTSLPVSLILEKVGYDNQANFNRQFKSYKQVTPTQYRIAMKRH
ncbi:helix-turn-helix transcriptional regulator [Vibrio splendidus]|uniref:helix-turn-helix transcriptional regulator n=1 Tax=Vibrio splendidus TaxID=29497 RepID=UPI000D3C0DA3|nr:AraC family transcriptional regulator [Vibrio splendidus]MCC4788585.1 AraC family transcriptional regulator [Vibrio splendidus]MCW4439152.1 AraC family transcriptional regulator [Vibrio splendidus]PTO61266.1 AraC family transcriptional regulator [Vibrio splendidus]PTP06222.1 AraC family transcriptional regulator [Vibrio splendidus]PTP53687.1 AraC family transcriptional regulator [Vibrio splendidus]